MVILIANWLSNRHSNFRSEVIQLEDNHGKWAYFARMMSMTYGFNSCLHGVSYPITHTQLYFKQNGMSNRVDSEIITVQ